jgi:hypothetical protein
MSCSGIRKAAVLLAGSGLAFLAGAQPPPQVGTGADSAHVFLTFSAGKSLAENPTTANNYMKAIDPTGAKKDFVSWLVNAGFISKASDWTPSGQQIYTSVPGDYGPNKVNAFAHIIILNTADLGFIRNQYIRCKPDCKTPNAKVYTYLENYGATQLTFDSNGVAIKDSNGNFVTTVNTPEAVSTALETRPVAGVGKRIADVAFEWAPAANGSNPTHNFGQIYAYVIVPQFQQFVCDGSPDSKNGEILGGTFSVPVNGPNNKQIIDEQYVWPVGYVDPGLTADQQVNQKFYNCAFNQSTDGGLHGRRHPTPQFSDQSPDLTHIGFRNPVPDYPVIAGQVFAPELDSLGTKMMPGVCLMCHGGNIPSTLASTQSWGTTGEIPEFRFLPADAVNSVFGTNDVGRPLFPGVGGIGVSGADMTEPGQAAELKKYAQAVAITHGAVPAKTATFSLADGTITGQWNVGRSPDHALQVLFGWYQSADGDYSMSGGNLQNRTFVPVGWRTGPGGTNRLYTQVIQRECRSCHLNREPSLDFRTQQQFDGNAGNIRDWVFQPECDFLLGEVKPSNITMPAARLTWERLWNGILGDSTAAEPFALPPSPVVINNQTLFGAGSVSATTTDSDINLLKAHFGYTATSFCAGKH